MENNQSEMGEDTNKEGVPTPPTNEVKTGEPLPQETVIYKYIDATQQRSFWSKKYDTAKEVVDTLKNSLGIHSSEAEKETLMQKENDLQKFQTEMYKMDLIVGTMYAQISDESKENYLSDKNTERLEQLMMEQEEKEQEERAQYYIENKVEPTIKPEEKIEYGPVAEKFEQLISSFETAHSIESLSAVQQLSPEIHNLFLKDYDMTAQQIEIAFNGLSAEDKEIYVMWTAAENDLKDINASITFLKEKTNIAPEVYDQLNAKYKKLSRAVGMLQTNNTKVDHTR